MRNAVGFYWTLPVPWAGFTTLPKDIDAAAKASRTIRYQRDLIRRRAREMQMRLVKEEVFLEIAPDRGSRHVVDALRPLARICKDEQAVLLLVDFSEVQGWRDHSPLKDWAARAGTEVVTVWPDAIRIDGETFDPHAHFSVWREQQDDWTRDKSERVARALEEARRLRAAGLTYAAIAKDLNDAGVKSASGKPWTADGIRKLLKDASGQTDAG